MANQACHECGKSLEEAEMIQFSGSWVCADCKPIFMQKLKEGVTDTANLRYAGFWIRFVAKIVDGIILGVVNNIVGRVLIGGAPTPGDVGVAVSIQLLIQVAYEGWFIGKYGATPGKMACKIKVVTPDGGKVSYGLAVGRYFATILSGMILAIGYIMAAFDDEKRALHDRICGTRVVYNE